MEKAAEVLLSKGLNDASSGYLQEKLNEAATTKARIEIELVSARQKLDKLNRKEQEEQSLIDFKVNQREAYLQIRALLRNLSHEKKRLLTQRMLRDDRIVITPPFNEDVEGKITLPKLPRGKSHLRFDLSDIEADWRFNLPILQELLQDAINGNGAAEHSGTAGGNRQPNPVNAGGGIG